MKKKWFEQGRSIAQPGLGTTRVHTFLLCLSILYSFSFQRSGKANELRHILSVFCLCIFLSQFQIRGVRVLLVFSDLSLYWLASLKRSVKAKERGREGERELEIEREGEGVVGREWERWRKSEWEGFSLALICMIGFPTVWLRLVNESDNVVSFIRITSAKPTSN